MAAENRIEILIEAQNKASAVINTIADELKGLKAAASGAGTAISKVSEGLTKPLKSTMMVTSIVEDPAFTKARELLTKPLKSSIVFTTTTDDGGSTRLKAQADYWNSYYKQQADAAKATALHAKEAARAQAEAAKQTQHYGSALGEVGSLVQKAFASYLVYEFLSTLKDATSAVLNWMGNIETYGIAIAASLQVGGKYIDTLTGKAIEGKAAFALAQKEAAAVIESLQVANFQTVATLDQLIRMYQEALPIAMKKGFDKKMVEEFTLSVTQAASAMGVSMDMMAEEARSLLTGAINMRNSRVAVALGITPEDVRRNSASADQLFSFLMGKLQVYRTAGEELQNSWRGLWSNFKDVMMQAGGKALEPLFEGIKQQLKDTIDSIITLDKAAGKIIWNPEFLEGINAIRDAVKDAWYYATLLKEVGSAGVGAVQAVTKSVGGSGSVGVTDIGMGYAKFMTNPFGAMVDLIKSGIGGGVSLEPIKEYFKERQTSAGKFAANRTVVESGLTEREIADIHIKNAAEKYDIPVEDLAGIAFAENNFRNTMSTKDAQGKRAYGYMQLRESTAKDYGIDLSNIMDPQTNIEGGAKHYKMLLDRYNGDREKAMESYNKGQGFMENYTAGKYSDPNKEYKVYGKIQSADDVKKIAKEADDYYRKAATFADETKKSQYYGKETSEEKRVKAEFQTQVGMTELNQKGWQEAYKKQIASAEVLHTQEVKEAVNVGNDLKQNLKNQLLSKEEIKEQEAEIDKASLEQKLVADKKYLASYQFFTDEMQNLKDKEGKGIYTSADEKETADDKATKEQAKIRQDIRDREIQLGTADSTVTQRKNEEARAGDLEAAKEKIGVAQFEYDNLKKINDLKLSFNLITPTAALESEYAARIKLLEAQKAGILVEQESANTGTKSAELGQRLTKINEELSDTERKRLETAQAEIQTFEIKERQLESLLAAETAYSKVIGDPNAIEQLTNRLEQSKLLAEAYVLEATNQKELAQVYRDTAAALKELNTGPDFFVGFKTAVRDTTLEIGSNVQQWAGLFKGAFGDIKSSLSGGLVDWWKGNINWNKSGDLSSVTNQLADNDAKRANLNLLKEQITANESLTAAQKKEQTAAVDAQLAQLDAQKQLLDAQKASIENSKGLGELWQGFLDSITGKIADFMAGKVVQEFLNLLSGEGFGKSKVGAFSAPGWIKDLLGTKKEAPVIDQTAGIKAAADDIVNSTRDGVDRSAQVLQDGCVTKQAILEDCATKTDGTIAEGMASNDETIQTGVEAWEETFSENDLAKIVDEDWTNINTVTDGSLEDITDLIGGEDGITGWEGMFDGMDLATSWDGEWSDIFDSTGGWLESISKLISSWSDGLGGLFAGIASLFGGGGGGSGSGGSGGGGGSVGGIIGYAQQLYTWYGRITKAYNWVSGFFSEGVGGSLPAGEFGELGGATYSSAAASEGVGGSLAAGEFGELGGATYSSMAASEGVGGGLAAGEFGELGGATYSAATATTAGTSGAGTAAMSSGALAGGEGIGAGGAAFGAMEGAGAGAGAGGASSMSGALAATPALATVGFVLGAAFVTYKIIEGVNSMGLDLDKKAKAQLASSLSSLGTMSEKGTDEYSQRYNRGDKIYGRMRTDTEGNDITPTITKDSKDSEKVQFAADEILNIRTNRETAKLTKEETEKLINDALAPMNEELRKSVLAYDSLTAASIYAANGMKLPEKIAKDLKAQFAGMSQKAIEAIPNLQMYGATLKEIGINYSSYNSEIIDAALFTADMISAQDLLSGKMGEGAEQTALLNELLAAMKDEVAKNGTAFLKNIPNLNEYWEIIKRLGIAITDLPENKNVTINIDKNGEVPVVPPPTGQPSTDTTPVDDTSGVASGHKGGFVEKFHLGGFIEKFHKGGSLNYSPWGNLSSDEKPIIAKKGEYVLSQDDVEFVNKVKGGGNYQTINIPPILPRVNVVVNNQSGAAVQSSGAMRVSDDEFVVDVLLRDLHSNGRFRKALGFA